MVARRQTFEGLQSLVWKLQVSALFFCCSNSFTLRSLAMKVKFLSRNGRCCTNCMKGILRIGFCTDCPRECCSPSREAWIGDVKCCGSPFGDQSSDFGDGVFVQRMEYSWSSWYGSQMMFNERECDYVFGVDIDDASPAPRLPYNTTQHTYEAAVKFLSRPWHPDVLSR